METVNVIRLKCAVCLLVAFSSVRGYWKKTYEQDEEKLEKWYLDLHPDVNNITWPQVENLTQKMHRKICEKVFHEIQPFFNEFIWVDENNPDPEAPSTRVKGPVLLELKNEMLSITVVECIWDRNATLMTDIVPPQCILWLTHANSSRVFTLSREEHSDIFHLQTGLHPVSYRTTSK